MQATNRVRVDMATCPNGIMTQFIEKARDAQAALSRFVGRNGLGATFISLGENCSSAWYLKQVGLKNASFPFDWVFGSPEIVLDCINDGFAKFLDKSLIKPKNDKSRAGHEYYHSNFFNHRSPLGSEEDYRYYQRSCQRFIQNIESGEPTYYVITLINEVSERPAWAGGFTCNFFMPVNQDHVTVAELVASLRDKNRNCRFVVIDHYTSRERDVAFKNINEDVFFMVFNAGGRSTGTYYQDYLDDFCFKLIMIGLYGLHKDA